MSLTYGSNDTKTTGKLSQRGRPKLTHLASFLLIFLVLLVQFLKEPETIYDTGNPVVSKPATDPEVCENPPLLLQPLPTSPPREMTVLESAEKVAGQFDYSAEDVRKGVKAFISQMSGSYTHQRTPEICIDRLQTRD